MINPPPPEIDLYYVWHPHHSQESIDPTRGIQHDGSLSVFITKRNPSQSLLTINRSLPTMFFSTYKRADHFRLAQSRERRLPADQYFRVAHIRVPATSAFKIRKAKKEARRRLEGTSNWETGLDYCECFMNRRWWDGYRYFSWQTIPLSCIVEHDLKQAE
jgi:hypothetical protein